MWYKRIDGVWKFAGLCPDIRWYEHDYDKVFADTREELRGNDGGGETEKEKQSEAPVAVKQTPVGAE